MTTPHNSLAAKAPPFLTFLCTLNFVVAILGYSIAMALLSPLGVDVDVSSGGNRFFTWSYRAFALAVGVWTLISVRSRPLPKADWRIVLFAFFWALYLFRAFYDLEVRTDLLTERMMRPYFGLQAWNSIIFSTLVPILGILKSLDLIDFRRAANWIFYVGGVALLASLFSVQKVAAASWTGEIAGRTNASAMLNTIAFGHLGLSVAAVAFYTLTSEKQKLAKRLLGIALILLGAYVVLRAGSRGPILCAFVMAFFYALSRSRYAVVGVMLAGIFAGVVYLFFRQILDLLRAISPVMAERIASSVYEGDSSGRDTLFAEYWKEICDSPLTGVHLDLAGYTHNACYDGLLMFGFAFGWIILALALIGYLAYYRVLKLRMPNWWVALLAIQALTACQTSGTFGGNGFVQCLWVVCVVWTSSAFQKMHRNRGPIPATENVRGKPPRSRQFST